MKKSLSFIFVMLFFAGMFAMPHPAKATPGSPPTVTTDSATSITASSATLGGSITATPGANPTQRGFAYGTDSTLATGIGTTTLGSSVGTGSFSSAVSSLAADTTYYYRAYATNLAGTGYGSIDTFTTAALPPLNAGFDFRSTSAYVADPAGAQFVGQGTSYPTTNAGVTFGWVTTTGLASRDRSTSVDPRLAGIVFRTGGTSAFNDFRVDLPSAGTYTVTLALGDTGYVQTGNYAEIYDGTTLLATVNPSKASQPVGQLFDASGTLQPVSTFFASEVPLSLNFATTQLFVRLGTVNSGSGNGMISHLNVAAATSTGGTEDTGGTGGAVGRIIRLVGGLRLVGGVRLGGTSPIAP